MKLSYDIINCALEVHKVLGPGLLEKVYCECLFYVLLENGFDVEKEVPLRVKFREVEIDCGYRIDLLVENQILVEVKSVKELSDIHLAQMITYLKLGDFRLGLLINFNQVKLVDGIKRVANNFKEHP